jgi:hypothetical protein
MAFQERPLKGGVLYPKASLRKGESWPVEKLTASFANAAQHPGRHVPVACLMQSTL